MHSGGEEGVRDFFPLLLSCSGGLNVQQGLRVENDCPKDNFCLTKVSSDRKAKYCFFPYLSFRKQVNRQKRHYREKSRTRNALEKIIGQCGFLFAPCH